MHYSHPISPSFPECRVSMGNLVFPSMPMASSIVPQLEAIGLLPAVARQVSDTYMKAARDLHATCEASLRNAYRKASNHDDRVLHEDFQAIYKALNDAYAQQTGVWASTALTSARDTVTKTKTAAHDAQPIKEKKPVFNYEYTPLLEQYFEYNAYPSAPDRAVLARKSMMTPRQIEVWFQNHRNRARKEGKTLRRLSETSLPVDLPLKSLEDKMPFFTVPVNERRPSNKPTNTSDEPSDNEDLSSTTPSSIPTPPFTADTDALDPPRPPYAFPTVYIPCDLDLFNTQSRVYKFPPPLWHRTPTTHTRLPQTPIDMNEFALEFSQKLHLRVPASRRSHVSQPWCAGRYIPRCPAPHPALVRSSRASLISPIYTKRIRAIPESISRQHVFRSPSPSLPTTLVPLQTSCVTPTSCKAASLPKRIPKSKSLSRRRGSPGSSPEPAPLSTSSSPCISSSSSDISGRRASSSSSSSSSSSPTTPVMSCSSLPGDTSSSAVSVSGIDFDDMEDLVDNTNKIASTAENSFAFSAATQPKQRFPLFDTPAAHLSRNHLHWMHNSSS